MFAILYTLGMFICDLLKSWYRLQAIGPISTWQTWLSVAKAIGVQLNRQEHRAFDSVAGGRGASTQKVRMSPLTSERHPIGGNFMPAARNGMT